MTHIEIPKDKIAEFCKRNHVRKLSLFCSVLSNEFRPDIDVDILVEFEVGSRVGLIRMAGMEIELSKILGRKADLRTPADLSRYFRDDVLKSAEIQF